MHYVYLFAAIIAETIGTTALQASNQFSRLGPSLVVVVSYAAAFYLLSLTWAELPVGVVRFVVQLQVAGHGDLGALARAGRIGIAAGDKLAHQGRVNQIEACHMVRIKIDEIQPAQR